MTYIGDALGYLIPFLVVLTVLIFVHEFGHYWVARRCGVKVDSFSIGFGPEMFGWLDRAGTRWKVSWLPLGGYVKMFGDSNEASMSDASLAENLSEEEKRHTFAFKPLWQRAAVVVAGPMFNFIFTIIVFWVLFMTVGERFTTPDVGEVTAGSAAESAGIKPGDIFVSIDGHAIQRFEEIQQIVQLHPGVPLNVVLKNDSQQREVTVTPATVDETTRFGTTQRIGRLGIKHAGTELVKENPWVAGVQSFRETGWLIDGTLEALWQIVEGTRPADEMGGVISIARMSGDVAKTGAVDLIYFMALLSVNLGLLNLFPIPVLDGGHLLFYAVEAVKGKPLGEAILKYSFRFGLALVLTLAIFANWNDLVHLGLLDFVREHIS